MARFRLPIFSGLRYKLNMKTHFSVLLLFPFLAVALTVQAEVYKCRQPDGGTQISSEPCSGGASTVKTIQDDAVSEAAREQAERDVQRQRQMANQMKSERQADEAAERKEQEALRKASGAPSQAAVQQCLNTLGRMSLDSSRRAELESGCHATGTLQPVYVEGSQPVYYGSGYYRPPYVRPKPVPPIAPVVPPKYGKPPDLYKVPTAPRSVR